ncbi:MAG: DEAD/DEAH box helicase family protein [Verrucomicrobiota bacterium]|nr:DEAD/DEAH box helicase family protein [Verrucomicrobiota bacterium]
MPTPEELAREKIDKLLTACGWVVQAKSQINLAAAAGIALCELTFKTGEPDYTLFVDGKAIGTIEAKPVGATLTGVEEQSTKYVSGIPFRLAAWKSPLPFSYESTGEETFFTNRLDPEPRSRQVFAFHRPETLRDWVQQEKQLAQRLREFPPLQEGQLWEAQIQAINNLEKSFVSGRHRALIQMATGSGKTYTAVNFIYRLVKYGGAKRVLFLVDRGNLGRQTLTEFQQFVSPVNNYKFTEEYIVQYLSSNSLDSSARVVIGTIQRIYSMLKGEKEPAPDLDDLRIDAAESLFKQPVPVEYNPDFPIEEFDFIITDECHRSIYNLWRQVLEYFDASLIGLTATPSRQTFGFFRQNLVMEYNHEKAVADGVNVGSDIYRINTAITQSGSKVEAGFFVDKRDRQTRRVRWEQLDEVLAYDASNLDRDVVAPDQIRTVLSTFRDKVFTEMFPGRTDLPKTLIFAKDDTHADDIVRICREVFGKGNDFCQKITYRTGFVRIVEKKRDADGKEVEEIVWKRASSLTPDQILSAFRNSYFPRIAVTVDMIATGTDIKPLEIVFFMRSVNSKNFFEQMKGRGVRIVSDTEMEQVNPGIKRKTRYMIVDAVGVCERVQTESRPLEKKPTVSFERLLDAAALGTVEIAAVESLAGRLIRLERRFDAEVEKEVVETSKGQTLSQISKGILDAIDPDEVRAQAKSKKAEYYEPSEEDIAQVRDARIKQALAPLATNPDLRNLLKKIQKASEQTIDIISRDTLIYAGPSQTSTQTSAQLASSFREYIEQNKAEITALEILYSRPYKQRLTEPMLKELEKKLRENHASWTEDRLWDAFAVTEPKRVKGRSQAGRFADLVALVRFALEQQSVLAPFADSVSDRFDEWLMDKAKAGTVFTPEQLAWLNLMRDQIATSLSIESDDFEYAPFSQRGGLGKAHQLFGEQLPKLLDELNHVLAA